MHYTRHDVNRRNEASGEKRYVGTLSFLLNVSVHLKLLKMIKSIIFLEVKSKIEATHSNSSELAFCWTNTFK